MRVLDKKGVVHLDEGEMGPLPEIADEQSRPEIDRFVTHSFFIFIFSIAISYTPQDPASSNPPRFSRERHCQMEPQS